jgi:2-oxopent-4-enoate/cis-2-oxohex-4-enoate hydratase
MTIDIDGLASELYDARRTATAVAPLSERFGGITIDDAYRIQLAMVDRRCREGSERVVGKKIGVTSQPVMDLFQVTEPDFGFVTSDMIVDLGGTIAIDTLIAPKVEGEIAFILGEDLTGEDVTADRVMAATELLLPCLEIVDSRVADWKIRIQDTVADNASAAMVVLGDMAVRPDGFDLVRCGMTLEINGEMKSTGAGAASMGHPAEAVAWLARTMSRYDIPLKAGEVILSGSIGAMLPVAKGDYVRMSVCGLGNAEVRFA